MGKRSSFPRRKMDEYITPLKAVKPVVWHLARDGIKTFAEPCCADGQLVGHLESFGFTCVYQGDIRHGQDALQEFAFGNADAVVTNFPWTTGLLHPLLDHCLSFARPIWMLLNADWAHTVQAAPYIHHCSDIVAIGRVKWIPGSEFYAKDNCSWYRLQRQHLLGPHFHGREAA